MMNLNEYFRNLSVIFWGLLAGQVVFTAMALMMVQFFGAVMDFSGEIIVLFQAITVFFVVGSLIAIRMLTNTRLQKIQKEENLNKKLTAYRANLILIYALMEAPVFVVLIFYLMTANTLLLILSFLLIIAFFLKKPNRKRMIDELRINYLI